MSSTATLQTSEQWRAVLGTLGGRGSRTLLLLVYEGAAPATLVVVDRFRQSAEECGAVIPHYEVRRDRARELFQQIAGSLHLLEELPVLVAVGEPGRVLWRVAGSALSPSSFDELLGGRQFTVNARRLADHLVEGSRIPLQVVVRELLQNAADACTRAASHPDRSLDAEIQVDFSLDPGSIVLTVQDTGDGMTVADLQDKLLRVAGSGAAEFRSRFGDSEQRGFFGVGFLTALTVATQVRVRTQSLQPIERAVEWAWSSEDQQAAVCRPREPGHHGTRVELRLTPEISEKLSPEDLREMISRTARYVTVPVYYGSAVRPCNDLNPLWKRAAVDDGELLQFCQMHGEPDPFHILLLRVPYPFSGLLFIPSRNRDSLLGGGYHPQRVYLYVRGLLACTLEKDFLGGFEGLVGGVVCDDHLSPKLLRDAVHRDDVWEEHSGKLKALLESELAQMFDERPDTIRLLSQAFPRKLDSLLQESDLLRGKTSSHSFYSTSRGNRTFEAVLKTFEGRRINVSLPALAHTLTNLILQSNHQDYVQLEQMEDLRLFIRRCEDAGKLVVLSSEALADLAMSSLVKPLPRLRQKLLQLEVEPLFVRLEPPELPAFAFRLETRWYVAINVRCQEITRLEDHPNDQLVEYTIVDLVTSSLLLSGRTLDLSEQTELLDLKMEKLRDLLAAS